VQAQDSPLAEFDTEWSGLALLDFKLGRQGEIGSCTAVAPLPILLSGVSISSDMQIARMYGKFFSSPHNSQKRQIVPLHTKLVLILLDLIFKGVRNFPADLIVIARLIFLIVISRRIFKGLGFLVFHNCQFLVFSNRCTTKTWEDLVYLFSAGLGSSAGEGLLYALLLGSLSAGIARSELPFESFRTDGIHFCCWKPDCW